MKTKLELEPKRHFYLYAKGHYAVTNSVKDCTIIMSKYCDISAEFIHINDIVHLLLPEAYRHIHGFNQFEDFVSFTVPDYDIMYGRLYSGTSLELLLEKILSILRFSNIYDKNGKMLINIGEADESILPC